MRKTILHHSIQIRGLSAAPVNCCRFKDLSGKRIGCLAVISLAGYCNGRSAWLCNCDCGNQYIGTVESLSRANGVKSCGCEFDEHLSCPNRKLEVLATGGPGFLVDAWDWYGEKSLEFQRKGFTWTGRPCQHSWRSAQKEAGGSYYACTTLGRGIILELHRAILCAPPGQFVDHKDRKTLNNTRDNLRFATETESAINIVRRNKTGFRGVYRFKRTNSAREFYAQIKVAGRVRALGTFCTAEEAAIAYNAAAIEHHGQFAVLNELPAGRTAL